MHISVLTRCLRLVSSASRLVLVEYAVATDDGEEVVEDELLLFDDAL